MVEAQTPETQRLLVEAGVDETLAVAFSNAGYKTDKAASMCFCTGSAIDAFLKKFLVGNEGMSADDWEVHPYTGLFREALNGFKGEASNAAPAPAAGAKFAGLPLA